MLKFIYELLIIMPLQETKNHIKNQVTLALGIEKGSLIDFETTGLSKDDEHEIVSIGFITENKIDALKKLSTDKLRENLLSVNGIGKETADSIILYAFEKPIFVIDAYTKRIFSKLGMCNEDIDYDELQRMFTDNLNKDVELFKEYHALIVRLGKEKTLNTISPRN